MQKTVLLPANKGEGMEIAGAFTKQNGRMVMELTCTNRGPVVLSDFVMQFNKNALGLTPAEAPDFGVVRPGNSADATVPLLREPTMVVPAAPGTDPNQLQIAVKTNTGRVFFFTGTVPPNYLAS